MARKKRIRPRPKGSSWTHSNHDILNGRAFVYRTPINGDVWQLRMWLPEEKKHLRRSLKTRDLDTAIKLAEEKVLQTLSDVATGRKIFGTTLDELCKSYLEWRERDVTTGRITPERLGTIKSQLKHFIAFKDPTFKINELDRDSYYDYDTWRKLQSPTTKDVTIRNEYSTFNHMMGFGYRNGLSHIDKLEFRPISIKKGEIGRRDIFTLEEYDNLVRFMRTYTSKKSCPNEHERMERLLIRDCVLLKSNTMMRPGEIWQLKWDDIQGTETVSDESGQTIELVTIDIRKEISKTRNARRVISRGGEYLKRIHSRSTHTDNDNFIFSEIGGNRRLPVQKYYLHWKALMEGIGIGDYKKRNLTWYSLRHFGITCRIRSKVLLSDIAQVAGTSVSHIETHYGHYDDDMLRTTALKNFTVSKGGGISLMERD